jgi:hypothetical protein
LIYGVFLFTSGLFNGLFMCKGEPMPQHKSDLPPADQLARLVEAGASLRDLGQRFGVSHMTIRHRLQRYQKGVTGAT